MLKVKINKEENMEERIYCYERNGCKTYMAIDTSYSVKFFNTSFPEGTSDYQKGRFLEEAETALIYELDYEDALKFGY